MQTAAGRMHGQGLLPLMMPLRVSLDARMWGVPVTSSARG